MSLKGYSLIVPGTSLSLSRRPIGSTVSVRSEDAIGDGNDLRDR